MKNKGSRIKGTVSRDKDERTYQILGPVKIARFPLEI